MSNITEHPTEILPGRPPFIVFFLPQVWAVLLALLFEYFGLEQGLTALSAQQHNRYALLGLAFLVLANVHSYLSGCVVCARTDYNVKLPNLYADYRGSSNDGKKSTTSKANAIRFNCIQRGHQNFVENLPQVIISTLILVLLERPNVAGLMVLIVGIARIFYARGYRRNVKDRFPYFLLAQFAGLVGAGYGALAAASIVNVGPFAVGAPATSN